MFKLLTFLWGIAGLAYAFDQMCGIGKQLLPITEKNFPISARKFIFLEKMGFNISPNATRLRNNGKTIIIKLFYAKNYARITQGPYGNDTYRLDFMYFNWLKETQIAEGTLPMELHVVFRNIKYKTYRIARERNFGFTVWSFRYSNEFLFQSDPMLKYTYKALKSIRQPNTTTWLYHPRDINPEPNVLITFSANYYTYLGRLAPWLHPCSGDVIWLEFNSSNTIYEKAYKCFKRLKSYNNTRLIDQFQTYRSPDGPIFQNQDGSQDYDLADIGFEYFNATSEDDVGYDEDDSMVNKANNVIRGSWFIFIFIIGMSLLTVVLGL